MGHLENDRLRTDRLMRLFQIRLEMRVLDKDPRPHYAGDLLYFGNAFTLTCAEGTFGATLCLREGIAPSPPVSENVLLHLINWDLRRIA